jgi:hypothetical protein
VVIVGRSACGGGLRLDEGLGAGWPVWAPRWSLTHNHPTRHTRTSPLPSMASAPYLARPPHAPTRQSDKDSREDLQKVFALFDDDQSGRISLRNLKRVAKELGEQMSGGWGGLVGLIWSVGLVDGLVGWLVGC